MERLSFQPSHFLRISMPTITKWGLGLPFLRSKCDALLLKQMLRMIISRRNCYSHICFWMGYRLGLQGCKDYIHFKTSQRNRKVEHTPKLFLYMLDLFEEAKLSERFSLNALTSATTKSLYQSYTETMPPPQICLKYPERDFRLIWERVNRGVLNKNARNHVYILMHERVPTKERCNRLIGNRHDSPG